MSGTLRVLIVEDDLLSQKLFRFVLGGRGHEVLTASTVGEGLARVGEFSPELVVCDLKLPGGGGETFLQQFRQLPGMELVPVVAVTAQAMRGDRERVLELGFDGYLAKPIDTRTFGPELEAVALRAGAVLAH